MIDRKIRVAIGVVALLGVGFVFGMVLSDVSSRAGDTHPAVSSVPIRDVAALDSDRALRDLLGTASDGSILEIEGERAVFWRRHSFEQRGVGHHVFFFAMKPISASGELVKCIECEPGLAAVTYQQRGNEWVVLARNTFITQLGRYGELPLPDSFSTFSMGVTPTIAITESYKSNGDSSSSVHLFAFLGGWIYLSGFTTAAENMKSSRCLVDGHCYSWQGALKVLPTESDGFNDLVLERQGTMEDLRSGELLPAGTSTYQFMQAMYRGDDRSPPIQADPNANVDQGPARSAAQVVVSPSGSQWYAANVSFSRCVRSRSPAERIGMIQEEGRHAKMTDLPNGAVEIADQKGTSTEQFWTYYPNEDACIAALPSSQSVPSRYR